MLLSDNRNAGLQRAMRLIVSHHAIVKAQTEPMVKKMAHRNTYHGQGRLLKMQHVALVIAQNTRARLPTPALRSTSRRARTTYQSMIC
jgi:hypothetical protein